MSLAVKLKVNPKENSMKTRLFGGFFYIYVKVMIMALYLSHVDNSIWQTLKLLALA